MSTKALSEYIRIQKYARYLPESKRRETWQEQHKRVMDMHTYQLSHNLDDNKLNIPKVQEYFDFASEQFKKKHNLGSQRALQFGGKAILDKNTRIYNCSVTYINRPRVFAEIFWVLLCGCGVGFSVFKDFINQLPTIKSTDKGTFKFTIDDSIEGWAEALDVLINSYFNGTARPIFDFSQIRPAGAMIKSSGTKAPGPSGLKIALEKIEGLLERCIQHKQHRLRTIDAYDIVMHTADAVLSGGVRRSATICLFEKDDELMINAKTGDWYYENPQRSRSNNSCLLLRDKTSYEEFLDIFQKTKQFGEPGFIWSDSLYIAFNPCVEIGMLPVDISALNGVLPQNIKDLDPKHTGWQFCNLCEINGKKMKTEQNFYDACKSASILGTIQATYDKFPFLGETTERIVKREALLGVSITGMAENPIILFDPEVQKKGAKIVKDTNTEMAKLLGINPAARSTCIKPSGNSAGLLGTSSGIHPHHSSRYIKNIQISQADATLQHFKKYNPTAVMPSVWDESGSTACVSFTCEVPPGSKTKHQVSAFDLLNDVKLTQQNWIEAGKVKSRCAIPELSHNVSNTIHVKPDEWDDVGKIIYDNRKWYAGISLIPEDGDRHFPQAPFTSVYLPTEIISMYGDASMFASGLIVHADRAFQHKDFILEPLWIACDLVNNILPRDMFEKKYGKLTEEQIKWVMRAQKFASRYFEGDVKKMTFCLKDVNNWKHWCDLQREFKEVEWEQLIEEENNTKLSEEAACVGGACEIKRM